MKSTVDFLVIDFVKPFPINLFEFFVVAGPWFWLQNSNMCIIEGNLQLKKKKSAHNDFNSDIFKISYPLFNAIRSFLIFFKAAKCWGFIVRSPSSFLYILKASFAKSIALWYNCRSVRVNNVQKLSFDYHFYQRHDLLRKKAVKM